jgi:hypothetical protein
LEVTFCLLICYCSRSSLKRGIGGQLIPCNEPVFYCLNYDLVKDFLLNGGLLKLPTAILAKGEVMRHEVQQITVSDVHLYFFNESPFRANSVQVTKEQYFEQHDKSM